MKNLHISILTILTVGLLILGYLGTSEEREPSNAASQSKNLNNVVAGKASSPLIPSSPSKHPHIAPISESSAQAEHDFASEDLSGISMEDLQRERENMEEEIESQGVIEKLNSADGEAHAKLRQMWGPRFERLVSLRKEILQRRLATLSREVNQMTAKHQKTKEEGLNVESKSDL